VKFSGGLSPGRISRHVLLLGVVSVLAACVSRTPLAPFSSAILQPKGDAHRDLTQLPPPKGKVAVAVYGLRDQTGQYKPAPDSSFSTAVTQGAASMLIKSLKDSGWYLPVERENLQNLLTERKIIRALEIPAEKGVSPPALPQLMPAALIIEGGIVAYENNLRTGGAGANYLGVGASMQYRKDQVTVNLRSVDIRTGQVLNSISTSKTIFSYEIRPSVFRFVAFKDLLQFEAGITRNEPAQMCVQEAIDMAVIYLILQGVRDGLWSLRHADDLQSPLVQRYLKEM
jgi:curli production assembly/transport component CsgG